MGEFKPGDKVRWPSAEGMTHGRIVKKVTTYTKYDGLEVEASPTQPFYIVRSTRSGNFAAYRAEVLRKLK